MAIIMLGQLFQNTQKLLCYEEKVWMTTQYIILLIRSVLKLTLRPIRNITDDILAK